MKIHILTFFLIHHLPLNMDEFTALIDTFYSFEVKYYHHNITFNDDHDICRLSKAQFTDANTLSYLMNMRKLLYKEQYHHHGGLNIDIAINKRLRMIEKFNQKISQKKLMVH